MKNDPLKEYLKASEPDRVSKGYIWRTAIGLQAVDGLNPSRYLIDTAIRNIEGKINVSVFKNAKPRLGVSSIKTHAASGVFCSSCFLSYNTNVGSTRLAVVVWIFFNFERYFLTFLEGLETVRHDGREVNEYISTTLIVGNESKSFLLIEPLNSTITHRSVPP